RRFEVKVHQRVEVLELDLGEQGGADDAGVVNDCGDRFLTDLLCGLGRCRRIGQIDSDVPEILVGKGGRLNVERDHLVVLLQELLHHRQPDSGAAAGDD